MKLFRKSEILLTQQEITNWLIELRGNPYNPSSGFDVTAIFRAKLDNVDTYYFAGVNVEYPELRLSTHAEEGCIAAMATALGKKVEIVEGWVMGAPKGLNPGDKAPLANNNVTCCGKCRQQIAGFADPKVVIHSISLNGAQKKTTVEEFLPDAFSFRQFAPELLNAVPGQGVIQSIPNIEKKLLRQGKALSPKEIYEWLQQLESVDFATQSSQAVVVKLAENNYVAGVKIEEAAYVSINAMQSAMAIANTAFKNVKVEEVWAFSKNKDEAKRATSLGSITTAAGLPQYTAYKQAPTDKAALYEAPEPLALSAMQVLAEFAQNENILINIFNAEGAIKTIKLHDSARFIPIFARPETNPAPREVAKATP